MSLPSPSLGHDQTGLSTVRSQTVCLQGQGFQLCQLEPPDVFDLGQDAGALDTEATARISRVAGPTDEPRNNSLLSLPAFVSHTSRFDRPGYTSRSP